MLLTSVQLTPLLYPCMNHATFQRHADELTRGLYLFSLLGISKE